MGQYINHLKGLPLCNRPLEQRKKISEKDKSLHWKLSIEYFDGTRDQGYGGYINDGRWEVVSSDMSRYYKLTSSSALLDVGCAKGFLLEAFRNTTSMKETWGIDISRYALMSASKTLRNKLVLGNAKDLPFDNCTFDLVTCINSLHNILNINDVIEALKEIQRVSKRNSYITVGAYKNKDEKKILDDWAVVATTYMHEQDWLEIFDKAGYLGDYYWFKPNISFGNIK